VAIYKLHKSSIYTQLNMQTYIQTTCSMNDLRMFANTGLNSCAPSSGRTFNNVSTN